MAFETNIFLIIITFFVTFGASIVSGLSGAGGGFIITPFLIFIGMTPAQAVSTGKVGGVGSAIGALGAFRGKQLIHKKLVYPLMAITLVASVAAAFVIPHIDPTVFQVVIGVLLIVMIPSLFIKKESVHYSTRGNKFLGFLYAIYGVLAFLQATLGTGLATFITLLLMFGFGLRALEANATKRAVQIIQSLIVAGLTALQGLVLLWYAVANILGAILGSFVGSKLAIKGGDKVVKIFLAAFMLVSGVVLLITAA
ncbi:MAG: rane protein of unknown function [Candidatus Saccharibacteria bacterium]|nr:rane protein of unknown function [Candidatus Saccharibacteria bacterium]